MTQSFTKEFIKENCGCYTIEQLESCSFMQTSGDVELIDIINSEIPLKDKFWFAIRKAATINEQRQIAIEAAECVLPIYAAAAAAYAYSAADAAADAAAAYSAAAAAAYAYSAADAAADAAAAYSAAYAYSEKLLNILKSKVSEPITL